jgi:hypothetical protein
MRLYAEKKLIETKDDEIKCGIFQGHSLSPLLVCSSIILEVPVLRLNRVLE